MSGLVVYYASRAILSIAIAVLMAVSGTEIWLAALMGVVLLGLFLWAPHSGRYAVHPEFGATALRRDERTQGINDKAARNAFVAVMLALAAMLTYASSTGLAAIPGSFIQGTLMFGVLIYFVSDWIFRRT